MSLLEVILESTNWFTVALATLIFVVIYVYMQWSQVPPGPRGLPYIGYYPFMEEDLAAQLLQLSKKYGKVFCFTVTGQLYAHVMDSKTVREIAVTKSDCFEVRPTNFTLFRDLFGGGVFFQNGEEWKTLRKFFIQQFKEFGMGKKSQQGVIQDVLKEIVSSLNQNGGKSFSAVELFSGFANDVIRNLIFGGSKLDEDDVKRFNESYFTASEFIFGKRILLTGPVLKYILINFSPEYRNYRRHKQQVNTVLLKIIRQHEKEFDRNNIRNIVDAYINARILLQEKNDPKAKYFTERALVASLLQFFGDATLGVGWLTPAILNALSHHKDIQKAVQAELDEVVGRNRLPSLDDKGKLSYISAVIYETMRTTKLFPILPSLECTKETTIGGCRIPKGTVAVYNMWAAFHDPEVYDEPDKFDPTRFLSVDGKKPRCEVPFIFGIGKRSCAGESLVNMELLLYVATVLQHFDLHPVQEHATQYEEWNILLKATPRAT